MTGRYLDDFVTGQTLTSPSRTITENDLVQFAAQSGDWNPVHTDETFAADTQFGTRIAHGPMLIGIAFGLLSRVNFIDGTVIALREVRWTFDAPVFPGDTVHAVATVLTVKPSQSKPDRGHLGVQIDVYQQDDRLVQRGQCRLIMRRKQSDY